MNAILLDTDVFSYLIRIEDTRGELYRPFIKDKAVAISFVSIAELYFWAAKRKWGPQRIVRLEERLTACTFIPYDLELCKTYARVKSALPPGLVVPANDLWIAICAIRHSIPLLTNNKKDFVNIPGLTLQSIP
jgi:tRNA(fMet)-specific endonuclease VapC